MSKQVVLSNGDTVTLKGVYTRKMSKQFDELCSAHEETKVSAAKAFNEARDFIVINMIDKIENAIGVEIEASQEYVDRMASSDFVSVYEAIGSLSAPPKA